MSEHVILIGAEDVRSAGNTISHAAEEMKQAVRNFDYTLDRHHLFMDDWLQRFEAVLEKASNPNGYGHGIVQSGDMG